MNPWSMEVLAAGGRVNAWFGGSDVAWHYGPSSWQEPGHHPAPRSPRGRSAAHPLRRSSSRRREAPARKWLGPSASHRSSSASLNSTRARLIRVRSFERQPRILNVPVNVHEWATRPRGGGRDVYL